MYRLLRLKLCITMIRKNLLFFYHCWAILKDTDKWWISELPKEPIPQSLDASQIPGPSISLDSDHDPSPGTGNINSLRSKNKRPIGRKAEKASRRKSNVSEQNSGEFLNLLDEFNQQVHNSGEKKSSLVERKLNIEEIKIRCIESAEEREQMIHENEIMKMTPPTWTLKCNVTINCARTRLWLKFSHVQAAPNFIFLLLLIYNLCIFLYFLLM